MMEMSREMGRLCKAWRDLPAECPQSIQQRLAEQFLRYLGWNEMTPLAISDSSVSGLMLHESNGIAGFFLISDILEPGSAFRDRNLDFTEVTRLFVDASAALDVAYVFITDLCRFYLYDMQSEDLLLFIDDPAAFQMELFPVLKCENVQRGSLHELRRQPSSAAARQLREWQQRWCQRLEIEQAPEEVALIMDRIMALRFLAEYDILKTNAWQLSQRFHNLVEHARNGGQGCGRALLALMQDLYYDYDAALFAPDSLVDELLGKDYITTPLLKELSLLSSGKFCVSTILESFNFGDAQEKARVRMVPDPDEKLVDYLDKQTLMTINTAQIKIDISTEGYRAIFHWFDELQKRYETLRLEYETVRQQETDTKPTTDLIAWSEQDAMQPMALVNTLDHAVEHGLIIYYTTPRQLRTARMMLFMHYIGSCHRKNQRINRFPAMDAAFKLRPKVIQQDMIRTVVTRRSMGMIVDEGEAM